MDVQALLDPNVDYIGFYYTGYLTIIQYLEDIIGLNCYFNEAFTNCTVIPGYQLPVIQVNVTKNVSLSIEPEIYSKKLDDKTI